MSVVESIDIVVMLLESDFRDALSWALFTHFEDCSDDIDSASRDDYNGNKFAVCWSNFDFRWCEIWLQSDLIWLDGRSSCAHTSCCMKPRAIFNLADWTKVIRSGMRALQNLPIFKIDKILSGLHQVFTLHALTYLHTYCHFCLWQWEGGAAFGATAFWDVSYTPPTLQLQVDWVSMASEIGIGRRYCIVENGMGT